MPKIKKVRGIKQEYDRPWSIDTKITALNGVRKHLNRKGFRTYQEALDYLNEYKNKLESTYYKKETLRIIFYVIILCIFQTIYGPSNS